MVAALTPEQQDEYAAFQLELPPLDTEVVEDKPVATASAASAGGGDSPESGDTGFASAPRDEPQTP